MIILSARPLGIDLRGLVPRSCFFIAVSATIAVSAPIVASAQTTGSIPPGHCANLGQGFVPVSGSDACVRIGGHVRAAGLAASDVGGGSRQIGPSYVRAPGAAGLYPR